MTLLPRRQYGFTLLEVTLACGLTALLGLLLSTAWINLYRPTVDMVAWGQIFQEMDIAVASLTRDLGGCLPDDNSSSDKVHGQLLACKSSNDSNGNHLLLCFDGGSSPDGLADWGASTDDVIIDYYVDPATNKLIRKLSRSNHALDTSFTVAKNISIMTVTSSGSDCLQVDLTFAVYVKVSEKALTRKCTLIVKKSP